MRLILPVILMTASIVAPLAAGPGEPADPQGRGVAPGSASQAPERSSASYPPATIAQFLGSCVDCHDSDGRGEGGREVVKGVPDFTDLRWQGSRSDADLRRSILEGKGSSMPAMRAKIKPDDASRLVSLVRGFGGGRLVISEQPGGDGASSGAKVPPTDKVPGHEASPSRVAPASRRDSEASKRAATVRMFEQSCRKCHGADGKGDPLRATFPSIPDFTNRQWQQNTSKAQLTASILEGKSTHMPAFRSKLGNAQVDELVAYVRAFVPSQRESIGHQTEDFERRVAELQKEFDELRRAYRGLSPSPRRD